MEELASLQKKPLEQVLSLAALSADRMVKTGKRHEALPMGLLHCHLQRLLLPYNVAVLASKPLGKAAQLNPR